MHHSENIMKQPREDIYRKTQISVRLDPTLLTHIQYLCQSDEFATRTAFIERACNTYVEFKRLQNNVKQTKTVIK